MKQSFPHSDSLTAPPQKNIENENRDGAAHTHSNNKVDDNMTDCHRKRQLDTAKVDIGCDGSEDTGSSEDRLSFEMLDRWGRAAKQRRRGSGLQKKHTQGVSDSSELLMFQNSDFRPSKLRHK